jgi:hypothetical protein
MPDTTAALLFGRPKALSISSIHTTTLQHGPWHISNSTSSYLQMSHAAAASSGCARSYGHSSPAGRSQSSSAPSPRHWVGLAGVGSASVGIPHTLDSHAVPDLRLHPGLQGHRVLQQVAQDGADEALLAANTGAQARGWQRQ